MARYPRRFNYKQPFDDPTFILSYELFDLLDALDHQETSDVNKGIAKISPFFFPAFFDSKNGQQFKDSLPFNQEERAKNPPDIRSHTSNAFRPKEFWNVWDDATSKMTHPKDLETMPEHMDTTICPIIAHCKSTLTNAWEHESQQNPKEISTTYSIQSGVIRNRPDLHHEGQAMAGKEPGRDKYDLYFDWRELIPTVQMGSHMVNPAKVPAFKDTARAFSLKHPNARFAILKLWSVPYFYPLMIGLDNHDPTSFRDLHGRRWIWMFVPKDMPQSEWSIQLSAGLRIHPFKKQFGYRAVCKRDSYLIMGTDEKDLLKYACATAYAIQNRPWRWEVDLWKSWVNVDMDFLERLDERWLA